MCSACRVQRLSTHLRKMAYKKLRFAIVLALAGAAAASAYTEGERSVHAEADT